MASFSVTTPKSLVLLGASRVTHNRYQKQTHFFRFQRSNQNQTSTLRVHALLNEVVVEKSSTSAPLLEAKSSGGKEKLGIPDASSIAAFMTKVADLVELVDSRDIVELQVKQTECDVLTRKKEALPQPPIAAPVVTMPCPSPPAMLPPQLPPPQAPSPPSAGTLSSTPALAPEAPSPPKPSTSSHPPLKWPMAGTFYRSPAPGAPPFVKVGDKIQKGQVVCIIEAMKLMNEIEADQSGILVEILMDDANQLAWTRLCLSLSHEKSRWRFDY